MPGAYIYGFDAPDWRKVLVDGAGRLQVDTVIDNFPADYPLPAAQVVDLKDVDVGNFPADYPLPAAQVVDLKDVDVGNFPADYPLPAAQVVDLKQVTEQGTPSVRLYGWDGANWQTLLVEDATDFNLRVKLYDGADAIYSHAGAFGIGRAERGQFVRSMSYFDDGGALQPCGGRTSGGDDSSNAFYTPLVSAYLYGYDGTGWDRLRVYGTGILKVGRAEVGLLDVRLIIAGPVGAAGARKLYWMLLNPSAGLSLFELSDDTDGSTAVKIDHFDTARDGHMITFDPPVEFTNGIYLKTLTNMTSVIFGYL